MKDIVTLGVASAPAKATSEAKYNSVYFLAKQGFKAADVVALNPKNVKVADDGSVVVKGDSTTAKLPITEAVVLVGYMRDNEAAIKKHGLVFFGAKGALSIHNITRDFRSKLKRFQGLTLTDIGWSAPTKVRASVTPIETIDDIRSILAKFK